MKKFSLVMILFFLVISQNIFSLDRFAPKDAYLYLDFNVKNLDGIIKKIATKFISTRQFEINYSKFKKSMKRELNGLDVTDERLLKSNGIDINRRSGVVFAKIDFMQPEFFVGIAVNNSRRCRKFFYKIYKKHERKTKERVASYRNQSIHIIQKKSYGSNDYKDDFVTVALGRYFLISNKLDSIKHAIDNYKTEHNLAHDASFQQVAKTLNRQDQLLFLTISNSFMNYIQKKAAQFSGITTNKMTDLYKIVAIGIKGNQKKIIINGIAVLNKKHSLYSDIIETYKLKPNHFNLFEYLPKKPLLFLKVSFDAQKYMTLFLPTFWPDLQKELDKELDQATRDLNFDIRTNIINNLGNHYNLLLYDFDASTLPNVESDQFLKGLDFLAYAEVKNQNTLMKTINFFLEKLEKSKPDRTEAKVSQEDIEGITIYVVSDKQFSFYFTAYKSYFLLASKKKRLRQLIRNVQKGKKELINALDSSDLKNEMNNKIYNFFADFKSAYRNQKFPTSWSKEIKLKNLNYFHLFGGNQDENFDTTFKLVFR